MSFTILSVCTGNVCRSPIAELVLADLLSDAGVTVESAGIGALVGHGVPEPARRLALENDIDASGHTARQIDVSMIRGADLIVAMARDHRRYIVETVPAAMRKTFTLRELARIADAIEPRLPQTVSEAGATTTLEAMRAAVSMAAAMRGTVAPPAQQDEFDVIDPYRQSDEVYSRSFAELLPAAHRVAAYLTRAAHLVGSA